MKVICNSIVLNLYLMGKGLVVMFFFMLLMKILMRLLKLVWFFLVFLNWVYFINVLIIKYWLFIGRMGSFWLVWNYSFLLFGIIDGKISRSLFCIVKFKLMLWVWFFFLVMIGSYLLYSLYVVQMCKFWAGVFLIISFMIEIFGQKLFIFFWIVLFIGLGKLFILKFLF